MENKNIHSNYNFYIIFPGGYRVRDVFNDNTDIYVISKNDLSIVYMATIFTLDNVKDIMKKNDEKWFWSSDLIITSDLKRETIYQIVNDIKTNNLFYWDLIFLKLEKNYYEIFGTTEIEEYNL